MDWIDLAFKAVGTALIGYLIHRLTMHQDKALEEIKTAHLRINIHDRLASHVMENDFDSYQMAKGLQPFPRIKKPTREN